MARREFQFEDGSSKKFWAIELDGDRYVVHFGRIGTNGQTREKSFDSSEIAEREHDKQIASKTKKGYTEVGGDGHADDVPAPPKAKPKTKAAKAKAPAADAKQAVAETKAPAEVAEMRREIDLKPTERYVVTWEEHAPVERPAAVEFDRDDCMKRLEACQKQHYVDWGSAKIPMSPSREEAHFWLLARGFDNRGYREQSLANTLKAMEKAEIDGVMSIDEILTVLENRWGLHGGSFNCIYAILPLDQFMDCLQQYEDQTMGGNYYYSSYDDQFRALVAPYLSKEQRAVVLTKLEGRVPNQNRLTQGTLQFSGDEFLCSVLGHHQALAEILSGLADGALSEGEGLYYAQHTSLEWLVFGLPDRQSVIAEALRLGVFLHTPESVIAWLALTEFEALELIADSVAQITTKAEAAKLAKTITRVVAPEMAVPALQISINSKSPQVGQEWLRNHPLEAVVGLAPAAKGSGKVAAAAKNHLQTLSRSGMAEIFEAAEPHLEPEVRAWLRENIIDSDESSLEELAHDDLPDDLRTEFDSVKVGKAPVWLEPAALPPIKIGSKKLALADLSTLVAALKATPVGDASALMDALKAHAEPNSLDNFAWSFFELWLSMGAQAKEKWAMGTIGHLGGDGCVLNLTPLVRAWPGESQHQRAVFGLQCMRAVSSEAALMALNGIALKLKFKGLKERAKGLMEEIAKARGLTREELGDRIVPDCGLDERGTRVFDFGPRQFQFVLGGESKPMVRDAAGKMRPNLPKPNKSDDPDKSEAATAEWKVLKKTLRETLKIQSERLEDAMITGRRWTKDNFEAYIIKHPFMVNQARQLVFAVYDEKGEVTQSFRVTEDQTVADQEDEEATLSKNEAIGVVHPAQLDEAALSAWGEVLSDYGIIPPFQQLGRTICKPDLADLDSVEITRFKGPKIPGIVVYGILERSHWLRDTPADGGGFMQHSKYFPSCDTTAFIAYDPGLSIGWYDEEQELTSVYFVPGHIEPDWWGEHKNRVKIKDVDTVVQSEVLRLAHAIVAKAEQ